MQTVLPGNNEVSYGCDTLQADIEKSVDHMREAQDSGYWSKVVEDLKSDRRQRGVHDRTFEEALNSELIKQGVLPHLKVEGLDSRDYLLLTNTKSGQHAVISPDGERLLDLEVATGFIEAIHQACNESTAKKTELVRTSLRFTLEYASVRKRIQLSEAHEEKYGSNLVDAVLALYKGKERDEVLQFVPRTKEQKTADKIHEICVRIGREKYRRNERASLDRIHRVGDYRYRSDEDRLINVLEHQTPRQLSTMDEYYERRYGIRLERSLRFYMNGTRLETALGLIRETR